MAACPGERMPEFPVHWTFQAQWSKWWRVGLWVHVDLRSPMISVCLLWLMVGFGRMVDWKQYEPSD
jgi:hypothetical protein